jgi:ribosomal protein L5
MKIRKGQPLGAKVFITSGACLQFLHFFIFNLMPRLDLTQLISYSKESKDFKLFLRSSSIFSVLQPFFNFFQFLPSIQVVFTLKRPSDVKKIFFWRFLKLPVSYLRKSS